MKSDPSIYIVISCQSNQEDGDEEDNEDFVKSPQQAKKDSIGLLVVSHVGEPVKG